MMSIKSLEDVFVSMLAILSDVLLNIGPLWIIFGSEKALRT
jgi:hypothetical protein